MAEFFISGHMLSMWNFQAHMPSMSSMWIKKTIPVGINIDKLQHWPLQILPLKSVYQFDETKLESLSFKFR